MVCYVLYRIVVKVKLNILLAGIRKKVPQFVCMLESNSSQLFYLKTGYQRNIRR